MNDADVTTYEQRMHCRLCIMRAIRDGFPLLADAMIQIYRVQFPSK